MGDDQFNVPDMARRVSLRAELSRRSLLKRAGAGALGLSALATLLDACGSGSSTPAATTAAAATSSSAAPATAAPTSAATTASGSSATPTATKAASSPATPAASPSASGSFTVVPAKHKGGQLIEGTFADAKTLCPIIVSDTSSGAVQSMIMGRLMQADVTNTQPAGDLAQKWDISSDGITYTFTLRDGVKWHDGQPFTADDVKFSFDLYMNPKTGSPRTSQLTDRIKSADVKDPKTIVFTLNHPTAPLLVVDMANRLVPQHILKDVDPAQLAQSDYATGKKGVTIGTGPFMFEEWVKDDHTTLVKYADYWEGEPNLDKWIYKIVPDQTVVAQQLKTGELDYAGIQPADLQDMQKQTNVTVVPYNTFSFTFYAYQLDPSHTPIFQDKEVRQALLYALDRKAMIDAIDFGQAEVAIGTEPKLSWAYAPDQITNKYPYDLNKANQLLDQAGWAKGSDGIRAKNGQKLSFKLWTNSGNQVREQYITVMQQQWKKLGVDASPQTEEWNAYLDRITKTHDFDIFLVGFAWGVDPDQTTMWSSDSYKGGFNMNKYSNPQVDDLLKQGLLTSDQAKRKQFYVQMQNIVMEDLPSAILDFPKSLAVVNKRCHNVFPNAVNSHFNAHQWWVDS